MQAAGGTVHTFTIGFAEKHFDESENARRLAETLGTAHHCQVVSGADVLDVVPRLAGIYDQPFADSSQIPTWLVSDFTRRSVTVAISGDGGDELFGGYERYRYFENLDRLGRLPRPLRRAGAAMINSVPASWWDSAGSSRTSKYLPNSVRRGTASKMSKFAAVLASDDAGSRYSQVLRSNAHSAALLCGSPPDQQAPTRVLPSGLSPRELGMLSDTIDYLPNDILTKVDRAAMSVSLETRVPMLDPEIYRFAWALHPEDRFRDGMGKWPLRQVLARHVPSGPPSSPKRGFSVPLDNWLRGPLRDWADDLLSPCSVRNEGLLDPESVSALLVRQRSGQDIAHELWPVLMFRAWTLER